MEETVMYDVNGSFVGVIENNAGTSTTDRRWPYINLSIVSSKPAAESSHLLYALLVIN